MIYKRERERERERERDGERRVIERGHRRRTKDARPAIFIKKHIGPFIPLVRGNW